MGVYLSPQGSALSGVTNFPILHGTEKLPGLGDFRY